MSYVWFANVCAVFVRAFSSVYASMITASNMFNKINTMINMKIQNQICALIRPMSIISSKFQFPNIARKQEFTARGKVEKSRTSWPKKRWLFTTRHKKTHMKTMQKWIRSSVARCNVFVTMASLGWAAKDLNNLSMMMLGYTNKHKRKVFSADTMLSTATKNFCVAAWYNSRFSVDVPTFATSANSAAISPLDASTALRMEKNKLTMQRAMPSATQSTIFQKPM
mmetsp:Transcript_98615/g.250287  ORF Transcript_98615/g.250287 Transcript_98615/m.250287 type:complete len:224 (-) Transcript_98615:279-950(-)